MPKTSENIKQYVGIDVAKGHLDVCIYPDGKVQRIGNDHKAIKQFAKEVLKQYDILSITLESTGGYENTAIAVLQKDWPVTRAHPNYVHNFAKALGKRAKTDAIDARILAQYGQFHEENRRDVIPVDQPLQNLVSRRDQLQGILHAEKCRLQHSSDRLIRKTLQTMITTIEKQITALDTTIDAHIAASPEATRKKELLCSFKGIGPRVSANLLAYLPELGMLNKKEIAAIVGVAPYNRDSGTKEGKRFIHGGRQPVRNALYMAALVAIQHNKAIKPFYQKLIAAGKLPKVAITAAMRKIIVILNTMLKNKQEWKFANQS